MEFHFTVPELKALNKALERDLKTVIPNGENELEIEELTALKIRFERRLKEHEEKTKAFKE